MKTRDQYDREMAVARARLPAAQAKLKKLPGVLHVVAGIRVKGGQATEEVGFLVFVERKIPAGELADAQRIPKVVEGLPTDVIQEPVFTVEGEVLWGGASASTDLFGAGGGTLGAIGLATAANTFAAAGTPVLLTNQHVAEERGDVVGSGCMCNCCCCECGSIARVVDTRRTAKLDAAIATLFAGVRYTHAILGIGAVRGMAEAKAGDIIWKYGQTTGLTKGKVILEHRPPFQRSDNLVMSDQMLIAPEAPTTDVSNPGDSGSVYVHDDTRRIVGLHHSGAGNLATGCYVHTAANDGAADEMKIEFPVMGTAGAIPLASMPVSQPHPTLLDDVAALRRDLEKTEYGQRWIELLRQHAPEARHLVNHHRPTQVAWQRSQGPAFVAHFLKSARDGSHRVPREIGGMRAENAVITMAAVLQEHGSVELARAISEHYLTVLQCAEGAQSAQHLLTNAMCLAGAEGRHGK